MPTRKTTKKSKKKKVVEDEDVKQEQLPFIRMAFEAIIKTRSGVKGSSRQKIANYIKANFDVKAQGSAFNSALRRALKDGIERGVIAEGSSIQRFKITPLGRKENKEDKLSKKYDIEEIAEEEKKKKKAAKRAKAKKAKTSSKKKTKKQSTKKKKLTTRQKAAEKAKKEKAKKEAAKKKRGRPKGRTSKRRTRSSS